MPRKTRDLIRDLERAGKGSHRNYLHPRGVTVTRSGQSGNDAKLYQEKDVRRALAEIKR